MGPSIVAGMPAPFSAPGGRLTSAARHREPPGANVQRGEGAACSRHTSTLLLELDGAQAANPGNREPAPTARRPADGLLWPCNPSTCSVPAVTPAPTSFRPATPP